MKRVGILSMTALLFALTLLTGCGTLSSDGQVSQSEAEDLLESAVGESTAEDSAIAPLTPTDTVLVSASSSDAELKDADWVIQVDDTQDFTEKSGLLYHCNLYIYAQKAGGTDVLGHYTAQIVLKMELDEQQIADMMDEEGITLDSLSGANVNMEAPNAEFDMVSYSAQAYSAGMKEIAPDLPLLQVPDPEAMENAMALELFEMTFSMEGLSATGHDSGGVLSGGQGAGTEQTIQEPIVITVDGATVYVTFPKHGFERAFKGTIVGNVN